MKKIIISIFAICLSCIASVSFATHGDQGTGNYKGKRDKHEKPKPQNEKKKKSNNWVPQKGK